MTTLAQFTLNNGGKVRPLIIPSQLTNGTGLMNPSIINYNGKILVNLRHVNYTFYHSEKKLFQHPYGPLTYLHPENDMHLRTWNWILELDDSLEITKHTQIDTSKFPDQEKWDFIGLEDARLVCWNDKLYTTGVRRDTTPNGQGRMELCEIVIDDNSVREVSRIRLEPPNNANTYCEKNWMPILDQPNHYVKWTNPTEVVEVNLNNCTSKTTKLANAIPLPRDIRGGSQVIKFGEHYISITHEVDLFNSEVGRKDAVYYHRFIVWDDDWNIIKTSKEFSIMGGLVEFAVGMCEDNNGNVLITYGFQDNAAYVLQTTHENIMGFIDETHRNN